MSSPSAKVSTLVRRPAADVYGAFVEPAMLTRFWLSRASGPLALGATVEWDFMVAGVKDTVVVTALEPSKRIAVRWSDSSITEWTFEPVDSSTTIVRIAQSGFPNEDDDVVATAITATEGFTIVLSDLKILLETGSSPGLVRDKAQLIEMKKQ
jgi:uncharacterized protein YndB with AHSA1/START domain